MAGLARRLAPAAALGGLAVVIVAFLDPVFGSSGASASSAPANGTTGATDTAAATVSCDNPQQVTGPSVTTRWGPVQVQANVANGKLCSVNAIAWPQGDNRSVQINDYAIPQLDSAASSQGTAFDSISGATYTSEGYRSSLQQLLDSL